MATQPVVVRSAVKYEPYASTYFDIGSTSTAATSNYITFLTWTTDSTVTVGTTTNYYWSEAPPFKRALPRPRARARRLLRGTLNDFQRHSLTKHGYFDVVSPSGRLYRIKTGIAQNVFLLDAKGREVERLCAHPDASCPDFDAMLAQKLMLESCEEEFRATANRWRRVNNLWVAA